VTPDGGLYRFARNAFNQREFAGACFDSHGRTLFVNIQEPGLTFAIWGPWNRRQV
jgi:secreted PhoX family phosphatase